MDKQQHALRLADELETEWITPLEFQSAAELRRLHQVNQELVEALQNVVGAVWRSHGKLERDAIDKAEEILAKHKEQA